MSALASKERGIIKFRDHPLPRKVIHHGYRPRPHRRSHSCVVISRASRRGRAWKSFDWAAMERLHTKGLISDPVGKTKSVVFTDEGLRQSEALFRKLFTVGRQA